MNSKANTARGESVGGLRRFALVVADLSLLNGRRGAVKQRACLLNGEPDSLTQSPPIFALRPPRSAAERTCRSSSGVAIACATAHRLGSCPRAKVRVGSEKIQQRGSSLRLDPRRLLPRGTTTQTRGPAPWWRSTSRNGGVFGSAGERSAVFESLYGSSGLNLSGVGHRRAQGRAGCAGRPVRAQATLGMCGAPTGP
jgi:hypothetical protein